jgi:hypothetical protein
MLAAAEARGGASSGAASSASLSLPQVFERLNFGHRGGRVGDRWGTARWKLHALRPMHSDILYFYFFIYYAIHTIAHVLNTHTPKPQSGIWCPFLS